MAAIVNLLIFFQLSPLALLVHCEDKLDKPKVNPLDKPYYVDHFGMKIDWTDESQGWNATVRRNYLKMQKRINLQLAMGPTRFTESGYEKMPIPQHLFETVQSQKTGLIYPESCTFGIYYQLSNCQKITADGQILNQGNQFAVDFGSWKIVKKVLDYQLRSVVKEWSGMELGPNFIYSGYLKRYTNGAVLYEHLGKLPKSIFTVILNIDQRLEEPWPLRIMDFENQVQEIHLNPGEMLLLESANILQARQTPLNGEFCDLITVEFTVKDYEVFQELNEMQIHILNLLDKEIQDFNHQFE